MNRPRWVPVLGMVCAIACSGVLLVRAQDPVQVQSSDVAQYTTVHAECNYFGADHEKFAYTGLNARLSPARRAHALAAVTRGVATAVAGPPPGSPTSTFGATHKAGSIDSYL